MTNAYLGRVSRRTSLGMFGGTLAMSAIATLPTVAAAQPATRTRVSLATFMQDSGRMNSLMQGIAVMKQRVPSDPTSWFFQAAVHGVSADAIQQAEAIDPNVANVDQGRFWNQCPHFGQTSANFLPWHRAYLHYFEQILAQAAGDSTLALPYWDCADPSQRTFPQPFAPQFLDPAQTIPNPLHHEERDLPFAFGLFELSQGTVDVQAALSQTSFFGGQDNQGFAGGNADTEPGTQGLIERSPHNMIHFAVGGAVGSTAGAMGSVLTAAFDPVFWIHHAMIDKLWADWMCMPGRDWGALPDDAWFDAQPWAFHNANGTVVEDRRRSLMDHRSLGYTYDSDDPACTPLQLPTSPILTAGTTQTPKSNTETLVQIDVGATIAADALEIAIAETADLSVLTSPAASTARFAIEIDGLHINETPLMGYELYLVDPASFAGPDRSIPGYLGVLALFGLDHGDEAHEDAGPQTFDATRALTALPDPSKASLIVLPFDLLVPSANPAADVDPSLIADRADKLGAISFSTLRLVQN